MRKKIIIILFMLTTLAVTFTIWQYLNFMQGFQLSNIIIDKIVFGDPRIISQVNTKNLPVMINDSKNSDTELNIKVACDSEGEYELFLTSDREYLSTYVENAYITAGYTQSEALAAVQELSNDKYLIIHKKSIEPYKSGEKFVLTFSYKSWNIFNMFSQPDKTEINYQVDAAQTSGMEDDFLDSKLSSITGALIPKETFVQMEKIDAKCPTRTIKYTTYQIEQFTVSNVDCPFARGEADLGEDVTVEIYTSDFEQGKQALRDWLAENGLQESDKLRVEYVHKPG